MRYFNRAKITTLILISSIFILHFINFHCPTMGNKLAVGRLKISIDLSNINNVERCDPYWDQPWQTTGVILQKIPMTLVFSNSSNYPGLFDDYYISLNTAGLFQHSPVSPTLLSTIQSKRKYFRPQKYTFLSFLVATHTNDISQWHPVPKSRAHVWWRQVPSGDVRDPLVPVVATAKYTSYLSQHI